MSAPNTLEFPVLIGDIGGTNARFQIIEENHPNPVIFDSVRTAEFDRIETAISSAVLSRTATKPRSALIAAAGPITEDGLNLTNCHWDIVPDTFLKLESIAQLVLMNDFEAQALALPCLSPDDGCPLGEPGPQPGLNHTKAVLGPGTGLGVGLLVRAGDRWIPVAGEGGHVDLGPRTAREAAIWHHLEAIDGRISAEQVLCGSGLVNLYRACCHTDGVEPELDSPASISGAAMNGQNPQAVESLSCFCVVLGRVAGDLALTSLAKGGVYVSGGIAQKILPYLQSSAFRAAFDDKAPHAGLMGDIATIVVTHPLPALLGLAAFATSPKSYVLDISQRYWSR